MAFSERRNKRAFKRAEEVAKLNEGMVVGYTDAEGVPQYLVAPKDIDDETLRELVFNARHGRPMNKAEQLLSAAANGDFVSAYEQAMRHYIVDGKEEIAKETDRLKRMAHAED